MDSGVASPQVRPQPSVQHRLARNQTLDAARGSVKRRNLGQHLRRNRVTVSWKGGDMAGSAVAATSRSKISTVLRVTSGNFLEMFDFFLFGFYATYTSPPIC